MSIRVGGHDFRYPVQCIIQKFFLSGKENESSYIILNLKKKINKIFKLSIIYIGRYFWYLQTSGVMDMSTKDNSQL